MAACTIPQMLLDEDLSANATELPVKGRQGWLINQKISFGSYQSEKVHRGWTRSYDFDFFLLGFQGSRQRFNFELFSDHQTVYTVWAASQVRGVDLPIGRFTGAATALQDIFNFTVETKNSFAATLYNVHDKAPYRLLIMHPDDIRKNGRYAGFLTDNLDHHIEIIPVRKLADQRTIGMDIVGFEFREGNKAVAAVEIINNGKVWIHPGLSPQMQHTLATASATLLLQQSLDE